jgi:hypothetical protein
MLLKRWGYECAIVRPDEPATSRRLDRALAKVVARRPRLAPAAEHILLDGCRITDQSSHRRGIGVAVQRHALPAEVRPRSWPIAMPEARRSKRREKAPTLDDQRVLDVPLDHHRFSRHVRANVEAVLLLEHDGRPALGLK